MTTAAWNKELVKILCQSILQILAGCEAAVKSFKGHFCHVIGDIHLSYEELTPTLAQIDVCHALIPGHFWFEAPNPTTPLEILVCWVFDKLTVTEWVTVCVQGEVSRRPLAWIGIDGKVLSPYEQQKGNISPSNDANCWSCSTLVGGTFENWLLTPFSSNKIFNVLMSGSTTDIYFEFQDKTYSIKLFNTQERRRY